VESVAILVEETWNLADLFADEADFESAEQRLEAAIAPLDRWRGRATESAGVLAEALEAITDAYKDYALLRCYASVKSDEDTRVPKNQALRQRMELLGTTLAGRVAYLRPEILAADPGRIRSFVREEPRLSPHAQFLRDLIRGREHVLGPDEERILADSALLTRSPSSLYQVLHNVNLPRPELELSTGETVRLSPVAFHEHRTTQVRDDRLRVFPAYFSAYSDFEESLGENLYAAVKAHMFRARARKYESCLAAALESDDIPLGVYHNLIRRVREALPLLHRYFGLRAETLGLERLEYPDLYCPLTAAPPPRYTPDEAKRLLLESVAPLGPEYVQALTTALASRWIDWHPKPGKRSGAYSSGLAYDGHPYVLMNFTSDFESVSTLTHEMGHAMHSYFSNREQPFATADYSIFVAEVASTLNEALLSSRMLESAPTREERLAILGSYLDGFRGTLFRQAMFAEFELEIHERGERGEALTGERLNEIYLRLLREYHGHDQGVVHVAEAYAVEWAAIPHFYFNFYVYQYATGIVAATALAEAVRGEAPEAPERYLRFLGAGGSDYPLELLRQAGVDLEHGAPYAAALLAFERHLDQLETLLSSGDAG